MGRMSGLYLALMSPVSIFNTTHPGFCQFVAELYLLFSKQLFAMKNKCICSLPHTILWYWVAAVIQTIPWKLPPSYLTSFQGNYLLIARKRKIQMLLYVEYIHKKHLETFSPPYHIMCRGTINVRRQQRKSPKDAEKTDLVSYRERCYAY